MIYDPNIKKWFHFGSTMEDYTRHGDTKRQIIFLEGISVGLMRIYIHLHMLPIIYFGERDRQYYYMMHSINYMIILFNWFIFENLRGGSKRRA